MLRRQLLAILCCLLAACSPAPAGFHATDLTGATFGRDFALTDHHGQLRRLADFRGQAVVLFFGYTTCPDVCPTTLSRFAEVMKALGDDAARVQVLFVSLDPERDSAQRLAEFVPWFHPAFIGLRGDAEQTRQISAEFRVFSARRNIDGALGYVLDHSAGAYVFDPAGQLRLYIGEGANVDEIVQDLRVLIRH